MRTQRLLLVISLLCASFPSARVRAQETDAISLGLASGERFVPAPVIRKQDCVSFLETIFRPEEVITAGLDALSSTLQERPRQACITDILRETSGNLGVNAERIPIAYTDRYSERMDQLNEKIKCLPAGSPHAPGKKQLACAGKPVSAEEYQKAKAELEMLARSPYIFLQATESLTEKFVEEQRQVDELGVKIHACGPNPYSPENLLYKSFVANMDSFCHGQTYTAQEIAELRKRYAPLKAAYDRKREAEMKASLKITRVLVTTPSGLTDDAMSRLDALLPLARALACTNNYPAGTQEAKHWEATSGGADYCKGEGPGAYELLPERKEKFLAALGDPDLLYGKQQMARDAAVKKANASLLATIGDLTRPYIHRRLLANFKGYLGRQGDQASITAFCAANESEMKRDAKFSRLYLPENGFTRPLPFQNEKGWQHAEYGLSEAEYKAIQMYVGSFYRKINKPLYEHAKLDAELSLYKEVLDSALEKLPTFAGGPLQRHVTLPQRVLDQYKLNEVVTYDAYTSTTKKTSWSWEGNVKMIIYGGKSAKDVSQYNDDEQEVIFLPGTHFKVIGKERNGDITNLVLGEVDAHGDLLARLPVPADYTP